MSNPQATRRVHLDYPIDRVKEPILYHLVMDFGLIPNVYRANINVHTGGYLELELTGEPEAMERGLNMASRSKVFWVASGNFSSPPDMAKPTWISHALFRA